MKMNNRGRIRARREALLATAAGVILSASSAHMSHVEAFVSLSSASRTVGISSHKRTRNTCGPASSSFLTSTARDGESATVTVTDDLVEEESNASVIFANSRIKSQSLATTTSGIRYGPPPPTSSSASISSSTSISASSSSSDMRNANSSADGEGGSSSNKSLLERLTSLSTFASALCVLDCTVLPLITIALPLLGLTAGADGSTLSHTLHHLGHSLALYFVLPVGTFATTVAYANHRSALKCLPGMLGLALIYLSNASGASLHLHTATVGDISGGLNPLVQLVPHDVLHAIADGDGWAHRIVNVAGCALMLGGNWWSKQQRTADGGSSQGSTEGGGGGGVGACFVPGCDRVHGGDGVDGIEEVSFFRVERPDDLSK